MLWLLKGALCPGKTASMDGKICYPCSPPGRKRGNFLVQGGFSCFPNHKRKSRGEELGGKEAGILGFSCLSHSKRPEAPMAFQATDTNSVKPNEFLMLEKIKTRRPHLKSMSHTETETQNSMQGASQSGIRKQTLSPEP